MTGEVTQGQELGVETSATGRSREGRDGGDSASAPAADAPTPKVYEEAYVKTLRAEAAGYRTRLRELEAAEETRKQMEMTETQRLNARAEAAEARAHRVEVEAVRARAAALHGLPEALAEFITAEEQNGADAQAEKLAAGLRPRGDLPSAGGRNPASGGEQAAKLDEEQRFRVLRARVPSLASRVFQGG